MIGYCTINIVFLLCGFYIVETLYGLLRQKCLIQSLFILPHRAHQAGYCISNLQLQFFEFHLQDRLELRSHQINMPDPYRPAYYDSYTPQDQYNPSDYQVPLPFPSRISTHSMPNNSPLQSSHQHQLQLSQSRYSPQPPAIQHPPIGSDYYPPSTTRSRSVSRHHHHHHHRSHSRAGSSRRGSSDSGDHRSKSRGRNHSEVKGIGAGVVGAGLGGYLGHKFGGGTLGTVGGIVAGALGANALEKRHER